MADERSFDPTPRRLEEARRRGEVAFSRDLTSAAAMAAAIVALVMQGPALTARLFGYFREAFAAAPASGNATAALATGVGVLARALAAPLLAALVLALAAGALQTGGLLAFVRADLARLSPAAGLKRVFGGQAAWQVGKGLVKVAIVAVLAWITVRPVLGGVLALAGTPVPRMATALGLLAAQLAERVTVAALALGVADYLWTRRGHMQGMRMTREEVKREHKESEGDPSHRAERQRLHRELTEQRMLADVRKADFVVVNPDHIAVALRYDRDGDAAPVVVASGERLLAERIRQAAREAGVPIFRDVTLARSLRDLPEGQEIPAALYEAVAEILRTVYATGEAGGPAPPAGTATASASAAGTATRVDRASAGWKRA